VLLSGKSKLAGFRRQIMDRHPNVAVKLISHYARNALSQAEAAEVRRWLSEQSLAFASAAQQLGARAASFAT